MKPLDRLRELEAEWVEIVEANREIVNPVRTGIAAYLKATREVEEALIAYHAPARVK